MTQCVNAQANILPKYTTNDIGGNQSMYNSKMSGGRKTKSKRKMGCTRRKKSCRCHTRRRK